jgi:hypothetical protein
VGEDWMIWDIHESTNGQKRHKGSVFLLLHGKKFSVNVEYQKVYSFFKEDFHGCRGSTEE